jgi:hypothetical protein
LASPLPQATPPAGATVPSNPLANYRPVAQRSIALQRRKLLRAHKGTGPRPKSVAYDAADRKPALRGFLLDYRPGPTYATVLDTTATATKSHLNLPAWRYNFSNLRDKRMLSQTCDGLRFRDDLDLNHSE